MIHGMYCVQLVYVTDLRMLAILAYAAIIVESDVSQADRSAIFVPRQQLLKLGTLAQALTVLLVFCRC